jgi:predicted GH43/DUF377 family glycosyl hydrolase
MQLVRHSANPILEINPANDWEAGSVFNANVLYENGLFRMFYRATNDIRSGDAGGYVSSVGYAESQDGIHYDRHSEPLIIPDQSYEDGGGCEDPRVTKIGDEYFIYYTAVEVRDGRTNVRIALATTKDFKTVTKHGIVGPNCRSKAACLLPQALDGEYVMYYTWEADAPSSAIMHARFKSLDDVKAPPVGVIANTLSNYDDYVVVAPEDNAHSDNDISGVVRGPEVGAPPIMTERGWLFIYCPTNTESRREWQISAALLDPHEPWKVTATTDGPILKPETPEEEGGIVNHVTFPAGAVIVGDELYVYYGSGDQGVCLATCKLSDLLDNLN